MQVLNAKEDEVMSILSMVFQIFRDKNSQKLKGQSVIR